MTFQTKRNKPTEASPVKSSPGDKKDAISDDDTEPLLPRGAAVAAASGDLKAMRDVLILTVSSGLEIFQRRYAQQSKALQNERLINDQLQKEKDDLKHQRATLEAHFHDGREKSREKLDDLKSKLEMECKKRKRLEAENKEYRDQLYSATVEREEFSRIRKRLKLQNTELKASLDAREKPRLRISKASVSLMKENMDMRKMFDELNEKYQDQLQSLSHQISLLEQERTKRLSLADELDRAKDRLVQLQKHNHQLQEENNCSCKRSFSKPQATPPSAVDDSQPTIAIKSSLFEDRSFMRRFNDVEYIDL
eukprot:scaffold1376_cov125-Cylindrotheca_fusiformis.AAC.20